MKTDLEKIRQQLRKMAFGKPNDCVKLAMCEDVDIEKLDLSMLTMEAADVLYGVTMQEQGISKILHLDLDELQKQLGITA